jgi:hypothetical protein
VQHPVDRTSSVSSAVQTVYTVTEASRVAGISEKAIRRRLERGTLATTLARGEGMIRIPHQALQLAGLVDNRYRRTATSRQVDVLRNELLAKRARLSEVNNGGTTLSRAERLVILGAWTEAGLAEFDHDLGVWRASGDDAPFS